jgi:hypothetical protein
MVPEIDSPEAFTYKAPVGTVKVVRWHPLITWKVYKIYVNDTFLVEITKRDDIWVVPHPLIKDLYTSDLQAIGDEIDKQVELSNQTLQPTVDKLCAIATHSPGTIRR